jgi:hypothetical protein
MVVRKIVQNLLARCGMNLVGVFPPYGVEHVCVSPRGGAKCSIEHYRFQYTELQSKDD